MAAARRAGARAPAKGTTPRERRKSAREAAPATLSPLQTSSQRFSPLSAQWRAFCSALQRCVRSTTQFQCRRPASAARAPRCPPLARAASAGSAASASRCCAPRGRLPTSRTDLALATVALPLLLSCVRCCSWCAHDSPPSDAAGPAWRACGGACGAGRARAQRQQRNLGASPKRRRASRRCAAARPARHQPPGRALRPAASPRGWWLRPSALGGERVGGPNARRVEGLRLDLRSDQRATRALGPPARRAGLGPCCDLAAHPRPAPGALAAAAVGLTPKPRACALSFRRRCPPPRSPLLPPPAPRW